MYEGLPAAESDIPDSPVQTAYASPILPQSVSTQAEQQFQTQLHVSATSHAAAAHGTGVGLSKQAHAFPTSTNNALAGGACDGHASHTTA